MTGMDETCIYGLLALFGGIILWCLWVWIRDTNRFVMRRYHLKSECLRQPFRFLVLSDLHNKSYGKNNKKLVKAIRSQKVDAILVVGDMYTSKLPPKNKNGYEVALALFRQIAGICPIYYANGNHEQKTRVKQDVFSTMYEDYWRELKALGIRPLINERLSLDEFGVEICGVEIGREYYKRFRRKEMPENYLDQLLGRKKRDVCEILLAHNPDYFEEYAKWGADVVLSGHVHGGVVRLPILGGVLSPALHLFPQYDGGEFHKNRSVMLLGRGLGMHTIPVRMWNPGELLYVELVPQKNKV